MLKKSKEILLKIEIYFAEMLNLFQIRIFAILNDRVKNNKCDELNIKDIFAWNWIRISESREDITMYRIMSMIKKNKYKIICEDNKFLSTHKHVSCNGGNRLAYVCYQ